MRIDTCESLRWKGAPKMMEGGAGHGIPALLLIPGWQIRGWNPTQPCCCLGRLGEEVYSFFSNALNTASLSSTYSSWNKRPEERKKEFTKEGKSRVCWKPWKKTGEGAGNRSERGRILRWRERNWEDREERLGNLKRSSTNCKNSDFTEHRRRANERQKKKSPRKLPEREAWNTMKPWKRFSKLAGGGSSKHLHLFILLGKECKSKKWHRQRSDKSHIKRRVTKRKNKETRRKRDKGLWPMETFLDPKILTHAIIALF